MRQAAAVALGEINNTKAVEPLIKALRDPYPEVREAAALALGQLGDPRAADALNEALQDADQRVQKAAERALQEITEKNRPVTRAITIT